MPECSNSSSPNKSPTSIADLLIVTDLDGSLLDHHSYEPGRAGQLLRHLEQYGATVVLATSKTIAESKYWRNKLQVNAALIAENGGALLLPQDKEVHCLGIDRTEVLSQLHSLRAKYGYRFLGFHDLGAEGVMKVAQLSEEQALLAVQRHSGEPLLWQDSDAALAKMTIQLENLGLSVTRGGRFVHVQANVSKATALQAFKQLLGPELELSKDSGSAQVTAASEINSEKITIALGDSENDLHMLSVADQAILIRRHDGSHCHCQWPPHFNQDNILRSDRIGPEGWYEAMLLCLKKWSISVPFAL